MVRDYRMRRTILLWILLLLATPLLASAKGNTLADRLPGDPASNGFDAKALAEMQRAIVAGDFKQITSALIARDGKRVVVTTTSSQVQKAPRQTFQLLSQKLLPAIK